MPQDEIVAAAVRYQPPSFGAQEPVRPVIISMPRPAEHKDVVGTLYRFSSGAAVDCELGYITSNGEFVSASERGAA